MSLALTSTGLRTTTSDQLGSRVASLSLVRRVASGSAYIAWTEHEDGGC